MKKWIAFLLTLTLMFVFVGCKDPEVDPDPDDPVVEDVLPTAITLGGGQETMNVGDTLSLTYEITPSNTTNKNVTWKSSNEAVLKVDSAGGLTALAAGTATITVSCKAKSSVKATIDITVNAVHVDVTSIAISGKTEVEVGKTIMLGVTALPSGASNEVTWVSSDTAVATIDANGKVTGVAEGTVKFTATSTENTAIVAEHSVTVIPGTVVNPDDPTVKPTSIVLSYTNDTVEVGWKLQFSATVYPEGASQSVTWHSRKEEVATIDSKGYVLGIAEGTTYIYAVSVADPTIQSDYQKVTVTPDSSAGIVYPDMQGYVITIMNASSALTSIDPFLDGYTQQNKVFKQQAWTEVKQIYNCDIQVVAYPDEAPWGADRINWINAQAEAGTAQSDFYIISSNWLYQFAQAGSTHDATEYYNKWGKNAMQISEKASATYKKRLYALSTGIDETRNYVDIGLFYNFGWLKKLNVQSPAEIFNEGNWTYSAFKDWANNVQALLGDGEYALAGHPYYYWLGMTNAAGVKILDVNTVKNNIMTTRPRAAAALLRELAVAGSFDKAYTWAESSGSFVEGKAVMTSGCYWFIRDSGRWAATMWGEGNTEYGYVPFPRPDDVALEDTRLSETGTTLYMMASQRDGVHKSGMTYEDVYRAMNDTFLRTSKYYQNDPAYDAEGLKRTAAESKLDDPASVEAIMFYTATNVFYDAVHGFYMSTSESPIPSNIGNIVMSGNDYDAEMDADMVEYDSKFISVFAS
ncbi:MAG: Ig-like domain-containing protein [Candidatus Izemoplasmatales bacterium]|nr:Ig-like domain-containing protein [Candidatus Izemoplasmatales bacterium]